jgi:hypothetical protein
VRHQPLIAFTDLGAEARTEHDQAAPQGGTHARDVLLGLKKPCREPGAPYFRYLRARLCASGIEPVLPLPDLPGRAAAQV